MQYGSTGMKKQRKYKFSDSLESSLAWRHPPPFFLQGGVVEQHLQQFQERFPAKVEEIKRNLYVDDLISGGETSPRAMRLKETTQTIFGEANFELHKWHSNDPDLEAAAAAAHPPLTQSKLCKRAARSEAR